MRFRDVEAIIKKAKLNRKGYLPLRSVKSLGHIWNSKEILSFERDFQQFNILIEIL